MYTLDFETMKQVMQEHQKTGFLYADVPAGAAGISETCRIEINLMAGVMVSCAIVDSNGQLFSEKESVKKISRMGSLFWTFVPRQPVTTSPLSSPTTPGPVEVPIFPRRTVHLEQWQMRDWPRLHRGIFALADGTRNIAKISEMLSTSPELVDRALRDLQSISVIAMGPSAGKPRP